MGRHLWVGSIRNDVDADDLWTAFSRFGEVQDIQLQQAPTGGDCWAIVSYRWPASATAALAGLNPQQPALTWRNLKLREWVEDPPQRSNWRQQQHHHHQPHHQPHQYHQGQQPRSASGSAAWADLQDEEAEPLSPQRAAWQRQQQGWQQQQQQQREGSWGPAARAAEAHGTHDWADEEDWEEGEEDYDEDYDPLVELWVGNLSGRAARLSIRRAFECFGEVSSLQLQAAPGGRGLQFAFVELPASAAQTALDELDGLCVYELSGELQLKVKQSSRSVKALLSWQQGQQRKQQQQRQLARQQQQQGGAGPGAGLALEAVCEDGRVAPLQAARRVKKLVVCEGPPSRTLWVGNVGGHVAAEAMHGTFQRYGSVHRTRLFKAPGFQNPCQFGFVEMGSAAEAQRVHDALQGQTPAEICIGRPLKLRYAWPSKLVRPAGARWAAAAGAGAGAGAAVAHAHSSSQAFGSSRGTGSASGPAGGALQQPAGAAAASQAEAQRGAAGAASAAGAAAAPQQVLAPAAAPCCAACGAGVEVGLRRCSLCRAVHYCGRPCQVADWEAGHAADCGRLQQLGGAVQQPGATPEVIQLLLAALQQPGTRSAQLVEAALGRAAEAAPASAAGAVAGAGAAQ